MYSGDDDDNYFSYQASSSSPPWLAKFTIGYVVFICLAGGPIIYAWRKVRKYFLLRARRHRVASGGPEHHSSISKRLREKQEREAAAETGTYYEMTEVVRTGRHNIIVSGEAEISTQGDSASSLAAPSPSEAFTGTAPTSPAAGPQYNVIDIHYHGGGVLVRSRHRRAILEQALKKASEKMRLEESQEEEEVCLDCTCVDSNTLGMLCAFDACLGDDGDNSDDEDILDNSGHLRERSETCGSNRIELVEGSDADRTGAKDLAKAIASNDCESTQGHIENNDEIEGEFEGVEWAYLPPHVKGAAKILGYSRRLWDVGGTVVAEKKLWDHLTNKEKEAATTLGYNKVSFGVAKNSASSYFLTRQHASIPIFIFFISSIYSLTQLCVILSILASIPHTAILGSQSLCYR